MCNAAQPPCIKGISHCKNILNLLDKSLHYVKKDLYFYIPVPKNEMIVAYYGRPGVASMGVLGQYSVDELADKIKEKAAAIENKYL